MSWVVVAVIAYLCGALPFSVWLGKLFLKVDIRRYGDGNPGTANVFRAGSKFLGVAALILDISKAAVPVGLSYFNLGIRGIPMVVIAIAPVLGHVFSPFLGFRGGKAIAPSLGVWIGLTMWKASLAGVIGVLVGIAFLNSSGWALMLGLAAILVSLMVWMPDPLLFTVWLLQSILLTWTHRSDLRHKPGLRPWIARYLTRAGK